MFGQFIISKGASDGGGIYFFSSTAQNSDIYDTCFENTSNIVPSTSMRVFLML